MESKKRKVKHIFIVSDEALRRCGDAGLRGKMPPPSPDTGVTYTIDLLEPTGQALITIKREGGDTRRLLLPSTAFIAELA